MILNARIAGPKTVMRGNRELVAQALANLIDNAIKYAQDARGDRPCRSRWTRRTGRCAS